jgi:hypothetical protein
VITIGLAAGWFKLFPALASIDRLEDVRPVVRAELRPDMPPASP